jgi:carboxyl-terminal processing protease
VLPVAKLKAAAIILSLAALLAGAPAHAEPRVALIIGNADYGKEMGQLANPVNDAALMMKALTKAGFDIIAVTDADQKAMKRAISDFGKRLTAAGSDVTALFYYSGHGLQVAGENYLIPVNAHITAEADVDLEAISADTVLKQMQFADARVNIIILDACRNNPLPRGFRSAQMGLARMEAPRGSFVAYSTAPGEVASDGAGQNSPYTAALAAAITTPGAPIEEAFRDVRGSVLQETGNTQTPWESSSLTAPFFFMPAAPAPAVSQAPANTAPAEDARAVEVTFWNSIKDSKDPADFVAYLEQYPQGNFARLARNRLNLLTGTRVADATTAPAKQAQPTPAVEDPAPVQEAAAPAPAPTPADVDPDAAAKICHTDDKSPEERLAACQAALTKSGLDDIAKGDFTNEIGRAHYDLRQFEPAETAYREAMRLDPKEPVYPANLGLALSDAGDYAAAIDAYDKAVALAPKNAWNFYNRGLSHLYTGDTAKAVADLDAALAIDENFEILSTRGYVALADGNEKAAIEFTNRAVAHDDTGFGLQSIAVLYLAERDKDALAMADRQIADNSGYGYGQIWKAMLLTRAGKSGAARTLLQRTVADHKDDWPGMLIRWMLGKYDDETLLVKAHEGSRQDVQNQLCEANFYLGERQFTKGNKEAAAKYFTAALETKVYHYIEYYAAAAYLRRLKAQ